MALSVNNSSNVKLSAGGSFNGVYDDILQYAEILVSLNTNCLYTITFYYSSDKTNTDFTEVHNVNVVGSEALIYNLKPLFRYFKVRIVANTTSTYLRLQTIYKLSTNSIDVDNFPDGFDVLNFPKDNEGNLKVSVQNAIATDISGQTVIVGNFPATQPISGSISVSNFPASQPISGSVSVSNFPASQAVTNSDITNIYNVVNSKTSGSLWNANVTGVNGVSTSVNLSTKNIKNLTFMGNCNGATVLTVQFSSDGSNWYDSQYAYTLSASGDVGFNIPCCPNYVRLKSSASVTATMLLNCC